MEEHIRHSNLIEGIDDPEQDQQSLRAWEWLEKEKHISHGMIQALQGQITHGHLEPQYVGVYRPIQVYVGSHIPPAPAMVPSMMYSWGMNMNNDWKTLDPKMMHVQFETIHPFVDGNGRTGRMLMWWHQKKLNQFPTLIKVENRQEYYQWFKRGHHAD